VSTPNWQKSSYCGEGANCLNVAAAPDGTVRIRESDDPCRVLTSTVTQLRSFLLAVKAGEFDGVTA
jgi:hypothetical protein